MQDLFAKGLRLFILLVAFLQMPRSTYLIANRKLSRVDVNSLSDNETLDLVRIKSISVIRLGDGDFSFMAGNSMPSKGYLSSNLYGALLYRRTLRDFLKKSPSDVILCFPDIYAGGHIRPNINLLSWRLPYIVAISIFGSKINTYTFGSSFCFRPQNSYSITIESARDAVLDRVSQHEIVVGLGDVPIQVQDYSKEFRYLEVPERESISLFSEIYLSLSKLLVELNQDATPSSVCIVSVFGITGRLLGIRMKSDFPKVAFLDLGTLWQ